MNTPPLIVTNDFHSSVPEGRRLLATLREHRARGAWVVDGGDFFGGTAFHEFSQGTVEERLLAELYDALVPGNHDFADLMRLENPDRFPPVVCANLRPSATFSGRWESGLLLPEHGPKVGIVGYLGRQAYEAVPAHERAGFEFVEPTAELVAAERDRLLSAGADIVVGVSHSGFALDVADQQNGWPLPVVLSGHCHSPSYHWASTGRHVVKAPETGQGLLWLNLDRGGSHQFTVETVSDVYGPAVPDGLEATMSQYAAWGAEQIGTLPASLPDRRDVARRLAQRAQAATGADAFALSLWALRDGLPQTVTRHSLMNCAPFDTDLVLLDGEHHTETVRERARLLGEELVTYLLATASASACSLATTSYLAERLGLAARPLVPPRTLRGILTDLVTES
ncbi:MULTISPECIES: metallophosphoesterase [unclassified Streptomyces]|uniref:metallophosphoesterase n=1 Tax=unclassified Streptomyces TaxID=2593676 RepID=UPI00081EDDFA|nr:MULTISPECIES: metallophosphoesterase [unclassified Streptomyces]MYZ37954.1 phosphodiesterase [Streptomyces sp. SID4917]SCF95357.1 5'-nucleotidase [Streptomyces sp. MnatMP-M17]